MKKTLLIALIAVFCATSAFGQFRFEIGASAPLVGASSLESLGLGEEVADIVGTLGIIPIPNLGLLFQVDMGIIKLGIGAKIWTAILANLGYPMVQLELALGSLMIDASVGGYYFGYYTIPNVFGVEPAGFLIPDLSVWLALGKKKAFRLGGGLMGFTDVSDLASIDVSTLPFIAYAGLKVVL
ncbi:MAG TPA: hypothetical protein VIO60_09390 [Rectinemataceae bacterium]